MTDTFRVVALSALLLITPASITWAKGISNYKEWSRCQQDSQCALVEGSCGVEWAVNKDFVDLSRKNPPRMDMPCSKPLEDHPANTVAKCENDRCVLSPRGMYAGGTLIEWLDCSVSSDCAWIGLDCGGNGVAVNIKHKDEAYAMWCKAGSVCQSACAISVPPNSFAQCKNGQCITKPIEKQDQLPQTK